MKIIKQTIPIILIAFLMACGGGSKDTPAPPSKAIGLGYSNPNSSGYRFEKNTASTPEKLLLDLVGPPTDSGRGVSFTVHVDPSMVNIVKVIDSDFEYVQNGNIFDLGVAPQIRKGILSNGTLRVSLAQKGQANSKLLTGTLARIAFSLKSNTGLSVGTPIPISVAEGYILKATGRPTQLDLQMGNLTAQ